MYKYAYKLKARHDRLRKHTIDILKILIPPQWLITLIILSALGYACYLFVWRYALNLKHFL